MAESRGWMAGLDEGMTLALRHGVRSSRKRSTRKYRVSLYQEQEMVAKMKARVYKELLKLEKRRAGEPTDDSDLEGDEMERREEMSATVEPGTEDFDDDAGGDRLSRELRRREKERMGGATRIGGQTQGWEVVESVGEPGPAREALVSGYFSSHMGKDGGGERRPAARRATRVVKR